MQKIFNKITQGYKKFRKKYANGSRSIMRHLAAYGQHPQIMIVSCCDSRVDPALILQCDPGDLFIVRNVANIIPPYEEDNKHHGTSAALEFAVCYLEVKHLIILGHSQCGGINALINTNNNDKKNNFVNNWVSVLKDIKNNNLINIDNYAKLALNQSYNNCLSFPWIKERLKQNKLAIHLWFFEIKNGIIYNFDYNKNIWLEL